MFLVIWNDSLTIGIPEIDRQHKQWMALLNTLVDAMFANCGKEEIKGIVDFLDLYVAQHFGFEETCMQRYKCPVASNNAAAHTKFIKTLSEVKQELQTKGSSLSLAIKLNEQLLDWFVNHINKKVDRELKSCISKP
ncbi:MULTISPECIES: hemerythrin family protein [unclassified Microcoleus]|uniref:hemerythrin family protein n=1 Tax=unclassified Microcoleus TaxID=2642155 RepID=UPI002FD21835